MKSLKALVQNAKSILPVKEKYKMIFPYFSGKNHDLLVISKNTFSTREPFGALSCGMKKHLKCPNVSLLNFNVNSVYLRKKKTESLPDVLLFSDNKFFEQAHAGGLLVKKRSCSNALDRGARSK